jgi:hypothetical protein
MGAEREPGETTTYWIPPSVRASTASLAAAREFREVTGPVCHPSTLWHFLPL